MLPIISEFCLEGNVIACKRHGSGHINESYLLQTSCGNSYLLQKINHHVFQDVPALMRNIAAVTRHLAQKISDPRHLLTLIPNSICLEKA